MTMVDTMQVGPWLIVAPHPDDESLGTGSLLVGIAEAGGRPSVAFLTDGAGSHRGAPDWSESRVSRARAAEGRNALRRLGVVDSPIRLDWPDADPHPPGSEGFERSARLLVAWGRRHRVRAIAVTWRGEPHCDHEAAAALAATVAQRLRAQLFEYLVWGWTVPDVEQAVRRYKSFAIDVVSGRPRQRRAIACHRSQLGTRITGARQAFRLPMSMVKLADRPQLILLSRGKQGAP